MSVSKLRSRQALRPHLRGMSAKPALRLVSSRTIEPAARPIAAIRHEAAASIARWFRGAEVPKGTSPAVILDLLGLHVREACGFHHPDDVRDIVCEAIAIMAEIESAAALAFQRPPRRRRPRVVRGEQLAFQFGDAA